MGAIARLRRSKGKQAWKSFSMTGLLKSKQNKQSPDWLEISANSFINEKLRSRATGTYMPAAPAHR
jgi:hypothetical protein